MRLQDIFFEKSKKSICTFDPIHSKKDWEKAIIDLWPKDRKDGPWKSCGLYFIAGGFLLLETDTMQTK